MQAGSPSKKSTTEDAAQREERALKRLLATPPDHKQSAEAKANPKKRGRPAKKKEPGN